MAKLKNNNSPPVSLFPVFNILVCLMGCLIFIVSTVITVSLGAGKNIKIAVEGDATGTHAKTPNYVEWDGKNIISYPAKDTSELTIDTSKFYTRNEFIKYIDSQIEQSRFSALLNRVSENREHEYFVFLLRPSGFDNFKIFSYYFRIKSIDVGYEPINQNWSIRID